MTQFYCKALAAMLFVFVVAEGLTTSSFAQLNPNDILVIDSDADNPESFPGSLQLVGLLFKVDPVTGERAIVSDFGDFLNTGPRGDSPEGVIVDSAGDILVIDSFAGTDRRGALFKIDPVTGNRAILSDFGNGNLGPLGEHPSDLALDSAGNIFVIDSSVIRDSLGGALFRVNPLDGRRTLLIDFGQIAQTLIPLGITIDGADNIWITIRSPFEAELIRVNSFDGSMTIISDFRDPTQGPIGSLFQTDVAIEPTGNIVVIDPDAGTAGQGALFRVDPFIGRRTVISDFGDFAFGPVGQNPRGLTVDAEGTILVLDPSVGTDLNGLLFGVDPMTGERFIISDFGDESMGLAGRTIADVALAQPPLLSPPDEVDDGGDMPPEPPSEEMPPIPPSEPEPPSVTTSEGGSGGGCSITHSRYRETASPHALILLAPAFSVGLRRLRIKLRDRRR